MRAENTPRISVVVPTRDRPDLLDFCLQSLAAQPFDGAEVIVCDNPTSVPAQDVFDRHAGEGWRYLRPDTPLEMHDNFEFACAEANGEFVAVVVDKTVLHPTALELAVAAIDTEPEADILTWRNEGYIPLDESGDVGRGLYMPMAQTVEPTVYDPRAELARRFANAERRGIDPVHYVRAKIVFGAYSRALLRRIAVESGRVFYPLAPDYTSMVPACVFARTAVDLGRPLLVSYNSARSNGRRQALDPAHARRFIGAVDPAIVDALPLPGVYASHHNVVAYDLVSAAARCPAGATPQLDMPNLLRRIREDFDEVAWADADERAAQYALLERAEAEQGVEPEASPAAAKQPRSLRQLISRAVGTASAAASRSKEEWTTYSSPVEAARAADRYHSQVTLR